jgi:hypothetical protein
MKIRNIVFPLLLACHLQACGQLGNHQHSEGKTMLYETISHPVARAAIEAWQQGDEKGWRALFSNDAKLFDDGHPRDLHQFSTEAIGHERFTSIDKIEDNGLSVYGKFHSDTWGDFKTYFKFHLDAQGKINKLEIGQADY